MRARLDDVRARMTQLHAAELRLTELLRDSEDATDGENCERLAILRA